MIFDSNFQQLIIIISISHLKNKNERSSIIEKSKVLYKEG